MEVSQINQELKKILTKENSPDKIDQLSKFAISVFYKGNIKKALSIIQESLNLSYLLNYKQGLAFCYNFKANTHINISDSMYYYFKALEIYEELNDHNGIASVYNNIGLQYKNNANYDQAFQYLQKSLKFKKIHNINPDITLSNIAGVLVSQKKFEEALNIYDEIIPNFINSHNITQVCYNYYYVADVYYQMQQFNESLQILEKIIEYNKEDYSINIYANACYLQGKNYMALTFFDSAYSKLSEAYDICEKQEIDDLLIDANKALYQLFFTHKNFEKACFCAELLLKNKMRIDKKKKNDDLKTIKEIHEYEKREIELNEQKKSLQYIASLSQFSNRFSSQINPSLTSILFKLSYLYIKASRKPEMPLESILHDIQFLSKNASFIDEMVKSVQSFTKLDQEIEFNDIDLKEVMINQINDHTDIFKLYKIDVHENFSEEAMVIYCSKPFIDFLLTQIFNNSINSINKRQNPGLIDIYLYSMNQQHIIKIKDNGIGCNESELENLYEPFFSKDKNNGHLGLGLYLVKSICDALKIELELHSEENQGFEIILKFPEQSNSSI